jgi:hypothetical protein
VPWPYTPTLSAPGIPIFRPAVRLPAMVPLAVPAPVALSSCFFEPIAACRMFVPVSVSEPSAFALIAPPAPKPAKIPGNSGTWRP